MSDRACRSGEREPVTHSCDALPLVLLMLSSCVLRVFFYSFGGQHTYYFGVWKRQYCYLRRHRQHTLRTTYQISVLEILVPVIFYTQQHRLLPTTTMSPTRSISRQTTCTALTGRDRAATSAATGSTTCEKPLRSQSWKSSIPIFPRYILS